MNEIQKRRKNLVEKLDEQQLMSGHFYRLWHKKSIIDNKTPRSLYTNPKKKISSEMWVKLVEVFEQKPLYISYPIEIPANVDQLYYKRMITGVNRRCCTIEKSAEQSDWLSILTKKHLTVNPDPKTLLFNRTKSKLLNSRNYQSPIRSRKKPATNGDNKNGHFHLLTQNLQQKNNLSDCLPISPILKSKSVVFGTKKDDDLKYYQFVEEVTKDIIDRGVFSDRALKSIIYFHLERRKNDLNIYKMRYLLSKLLDDVGVSKTGLFTIFAGKPSHPENVHFNIQSARKEWNVEDFAQFQASRLENSKNNLEKNLLKNESSISLNDQDIDDILEGRNISKILARVRKLGISTRNVDELMQSDDEKSISDDQKTIGDDLSDEFNECTTKSAEFSENNTETNKSSPDSSKKGGKTRENNKESSVSSSNGCSSTSSDDESSCSKFSNEVLEKLSKVSSKLPELPPVKLSLTSSSTRNSLSSIEEESNEHDDSKVSKNEHSESTNAKVESEINWAKTAMNSNAKDDEIQEVLDQNENENEDEHKSNISTSFPPVSVILPTKTSRNRRSSLDAESSMDIRNDISENGSEIVENENSKMNEHNGDENDTDSDKMFESGLNFEYNSEEFSDELTNSNSDHFLPLSSISEITEISSVFNTDTDRSENNREFELRPIPKPRRIAK